MKLTEARKVLSDNGILWSNLFDLNFVENSTPEAQREGKEEIFKAIKRIKMFIISGV